MTIIYLYSLVLLFLSGLLIYVLKFKHLLVMLLSLEMVVLSLFCLMMMFTMMLSSEQFISMIYLTVSVCEGALGLSLLVMVVRSHGSDAVSMFDNLW